MVTVLADERPTARIEHVCCNCNWPIAKGSTYVRQRSVWDRSAYTVKAHVICHYLWMAYCREMSLYDEDSWIDPMDFRREVLGQAVSISKDHIEWRWDDE